MALPTYKDIVDLMKKGATVEAQEQIMALSGKKRFSELERSLVSISPKVLTERLRELEAKQIVCRTVFPTVPPTTEYAHFHGKGFRNRNSCNARLRHVAA